MAKLAHHFAPGTTPLSPPHMYLADTLLDLYGEDLRARAFVFPDAERGNELCLRPDFTVPIALAHAAGGWNRAAAYAYQGLVYRRQPQGLGRPIEYLQAGIERFGDAPEVCAEADAEVFVAIWTGLRELGVSPSAVIGDLSIPFALLDAMDVPTRRRDALRRHFWRPSRFQDLLRRALVPAGPSQTRMDLLKAAGGEDPVAGVSELITQAGEPIGQRTPEEVIERSCALLAAGEEPPMTDVQVRVIDEMLAIHGSAPTAVKAMRAQLDAAGLSGAPTTAVDRFEARLDALARHGIDPASLTFDAIFGRNLEYYDGFVFELRAAGSHTHPPLAGGGRYDAMTTRLGASRPVSAVGGMVRPEAVLEMRA